MPNNNEDRLQDLSLLGMGRKTKYPENPDDAKLETFTNEYQKRDYWIRFECPEFTSRCPITDQPDFGHITISYIADERCIESKALKLYIYSFRNHNTFHEEVVNRMLDDLVEACDPREMIVEGNFKPRGGISIHVKATHKK